MANFEKREIGSVSVKICVTVEPSDEFRDVAHALGFVRVVPCFDCVYAGTPDCPMEDRDSVKYTAFFCSQGRKSDDD
ncbi:MAG: hypothetical protein SOZ36_05625 [Atopobiaceae bacterium]|nr:hypothetical protein [Atopobiaceae bacterium]